MKKKNIIEEIERLTDFSKPISKKQIEACSKIIQEMTAKYGGLRQILIDSYLLTQDLEDDIF